MHIAFTMSIPFLSVNTAKLEPSLFVQNRPEKKAHHSFGIQFAFNGFMVTSLNED